MCFCFYPATTRKLQNENVECRPPYIYSPYICYVKENNASLKKLQNKGEIKFIVQLATYLAS